MRPNNLDVLRFLMGCDANLAIRNKQGKTTLDLARSKGYGATASALEAGQARRAQPLP